jgi:hypothetical protein
MKDLVVAHGQTSFLYHTLIAFDLFVAFFVIRALHCVLKKSLCHDGLGSSSKLLKVIYRRKHAQLF